MPRPSLKSLGLLLVLALTGCPPDPPIICMDSAGPPRDPLMNGAQLAFVDERVTVELFPATGFGGGCFEEGTDPAVRPPPDTAFVRVMDPENLEVTDVVVETGSFAPVRVSFLPVKPGPYHVRVTFEPVGGVQQREVFAAVSFSPLAARTLPTTCDSLWRLEHDAYLCDQQLYRGGEVLGEPIVGVPVAVTESGIVWTMEETGSNVLAHQYAVDTPDGPLVDRTSQSVSGTLDQWAFAASDRHLVSLELIAWSGTSLRHWTVDEAGTVTHQGTALPDRSGDAFVASKALSAVVLSGDTAWLIESSGFAFDFQTRTRICPVTLHSDAAPVAGECAEVAGALLGVDRGELWLGHSFTGPLVARGLRLTDGSWRQIASLDVPMEIMPPVFPHAFEDPTSRGSQFSVPLFAVRLVGEEARLESYGPWIEGSGGARADVVWAAQPEGQTRVWEREAP